MHKRNPITPLIESKLLANLAGVKHVYLKLENCQPTGSFKDRGMQVICETMKQRGYRGVACSSGGNAGLAAAYAATMRDMSADIFVPTTTKPHVIQRLERLGATVHVGGQEWKFADEFTRAFCKENSVAYVSPFDDPLLWEGHSSLVDELQEQLAEMPNLIVASVGGGGLAAGIITGLNRSVWKGSVDVLFCETDGARSLDAAMQAGHPVSIEAITSIATSLGARQVSSGAFELIKNYSGKIDNIVTDDKAAVEGCIFLANEHRMMVEPACGVSVAGMLSWCKKACENSQGIAKKDMSIVLVLCGGSGVSLNILAEFQDRFAVSNTPFLD